VFILVSKAMCLRLSRAEGVLLRCCSSGPWFFVDYGFLSRCRGAGTVAVGIHKSKN
jgi:hypothetical protein